MTRKNRKFEEEILVKKGMVNSRTGLNVRTEPNGFILKVLKDKEIVSILEEKDGWGKIDENQWVNMAYINII